jgi:hypothetical protein
VDGILLLLSGGFMGRAKVVYLDEYRKAKQYKNLLQMIEGHLAEAGLLGNYSSICYRSSAELEACWQLWDDESETGSPES